MPYSIGHDDPIRLSLAEVERQYADEMNRPKHVIFCFPMGTLVKCLDATIKTNLQFRIFKSLCLLPLVALHLLQGVSIPR